MERARFRATLADVGRTLVHRLGFGYLAWAFDFVTTMDHDPLGKNWYIKGTDDGTGKPTLWVQS